MVSCDVMASSVSSTVSGDINTSHECVALVWFDLRRDSGGSLLAALRAINDNVRICMDTSSCLDSLRSSDETIFFISSSSDERLIGTAHLCDAVRAIFVLDPDATAVQGDFPKLIGVFTQQEELIRALKTVSTTFEQIQLEVFAFASDKAFLWWQLWRTEVSICFLSFYDCSLHPLRWSDIDEKIVSSWQNWTGHSRSSRLSRQSEMAEISRWVRSILPSGRRLPLVFSRTISVASSTICTDVTHRATSFALRFSVHRCRSSFATATTSETFCARTVLSWYETPERADRCVRNPNGKFSLRQWIFHVFQIENDRIAISYLGRLSARPFVRPIQSWFRRVRSICRNSWREWRSNDHVRRCD